MPGPTEFDIIEKYFSRSSEAQDIFIGIGDDAAVVDVRGTMVVAVDTLTAGVHFPENAPARSFGHRILAVNLSDLAAMGARPRWCTLALSLSVVDERWLDEFADGLYELAEQFDVRLIGGDLTRGPLGATLQLMGTVDKSAVLTRDGGRTGDDVYVTGTLGDSAGGLALLVEDSDDLGSAHRVLEKRFYYPIARVSAGLALAGLANSAIDVSDGLIADLGHICERSGCGALVDVERIPLSEELLTVFSRERAMGYALTGGDDYELCFTAAPEHAGAILAAMDECETPIAKIGQLVDGNGPILRRSGEPIDVPKPGYVHFP